MHAFVGFGSNLGDGKALIRGALRGIKENPGIESVRMSGFYRSAPWGMENQPDFTNAAAEIVTQMDPYQLLHMLQAIESKLGRRRDTGHWGPRTIDLDLLCCDQIVVNSPDLTLPHPHLHERAFALMPLLELDPDLVIPGVGSAKDCLSKLPHQEVYRLP